jgi:para-aminobenzoate synthetase/4-amino-4-deoxychorismate lyase
VRVSLDRAGALDVTVSPLPPAGVDPVKLELDEEPVCADNVFLHHKTTERAAFDERLQRHPDADDVVLVNDRGEVTETTIANLAVELDGQWWTPPQRCGLLAGVGRARLLASGRIGERVITVDDLARAEGVALVSSVRGWRRAVVQPS